MITIILKNTKYPVTTIFKGLKSFKNSAAQAYLHDYIRDEQQLKQKKTKIDYNTILKSSKGQFMIRQFLFQQKVSQNYVAPQNCYFLPTGKWDLQEGLKLISQINKMPSQQKTEQIIDSCKPALIAVFTQFYKRTGKAGYKFILSEQIGKIQRMTQKQFEQFTNILAEAKVSL